MRSTPQSLNLMRFSALIGILGGALDLGIGFLLIGDAAVSASGGMMQAASAYFGGILLLILGGTVLATAAYMSGSRMTAKRRLPARLMLVYGAVMLSVGIAMLARVFPLMQGSEVSGAAMIVVAIGMFYSGARMRNAS